MDAWTAASRGVRTPNAARRLILAATVTAAGGALTLIVWRWAEDARLAILAAGVVGSVAAGMALLLLLRLRDLARALQQADGVLDLRLQELTARDEELNRLNAELSERVQARTAELVRALREMETFNHSVSHDLRSPIGAILNFSAVLEEDYGSRLDPDGRRMLDRIRGAADRVNELLDSLSEYSSTETQPGTTVQLDMNELADRAFAEAVTREPSPGNVQFIRENLPPAVGDPDLVERVLVNLLGNTLRYSRGHLPQLIRVAASPGEGENIYRVAGSGGADPQHAAEMLEAFRRLHSRDIEGSGLGLAIASKIVSRLGGRVWGESDGAGATYYFTLPAPSIS